MLLSFQDEQINEKINTINLINGLQLCLLLILSSFVCQSSLPPLLCRCQTSSVSMMNDLVSVMMILLQFLLLYYYSRSLSLSRSSFSPSPSLIKSDQFECHGSLFIAIMIDLSQLYVRVILNLLHCSIFVRPNSKLTVFNHW